MGPEVPPPSIEELAAEVARLKRLAQTQLGHGDDPVEQQHTDTSAYGDLEPRSDQVITYKSRDRYEGDTLGNMKHGHGTYTSPAGDTYIGEWQYNKRQGKGHAIFKRFESAPAAPEQVLPVSYDGDWQDDRTQGQGTCVYQDGAVYTGDWLQDQRSGWGKHSFNSQDWYEGEWAADTMHGQGVLKFADGSHLKAEWLKGNPQKGHWCSADRKTEYEGQFRGMVWHGYGTMHQTCVKKYMGHWKEGLEHGHGQCVTADGLTYDGLWVHGVRQGQGKTSRGDGYLYSGSWLEDLPHGQGKCRFADGSKYEGEWQAGKRHGQGICLHANGDQYKGQWQADAHHGQGICVYASGDKYQGEWKEGKRHGHGTCHFADGTRFTGEWEDDAWLQSAAEPSLCIATGDGLSHATAGEEAEFVIQASDEVNNKRLSGGDVFVVTLIGPAGTESKAAVADMGDGTYSVKYCCSIAGGHDLQITTGDGDRVADSPYSVKVVPGPPVARNSVVSGHGRMKAVVGEAANFIIEGRDQYGNRCDGKLDMQLPVTVELSCKPFSCDVALTAQDNGCYSCQYTANQPGFYRLEVISNGVHLYGSPFSIQISEAPERATMNSEANQNQSAAPFKAQVQQQANAIANICQPLVDKVKLWEDVAAVEYGADGDVQGWHPHEARHESSEDKFLKTNPNVPVVENLEDIWLVNKLQNERKAAHAKQDQASQLQKYKQMSRHPPAK